MARLRDWKSRIGPLTLVAIGGLTVECIVRVFENGADSAAVVTDITRNSDPEQLILAWIAATRSPH